MLATRTFYGDGHCLADKASATVVGFTVIIPASLLFTLEILNSASEDLVIFVSLFSLSLLYQESVMGPGTPFTEQLNNSNCPSNTNLEAGMMCIWKSAKAPK